MSPINVRDAGEIERAVAVFAMSFNRGLILATSPAAYVRDHVRALVNTEAFQQSSRERKKVEMQFGLTESVLVHKCEVPTALSKVAFRGNP